jgi:hypothetical protein
LSMCWLWKQIAWLDSKVVKSHLIKRGFKKSYTIWITHGEIDDALLEVDIGGVGDDNSHDQDDGVFDGDDHDIDDDDFDYKELLRHVEPHVLNSMGIDRGLDNMEILEKSSREPLYDELNGCGKEFTKLHFVLELLKLKASHGWSDNSFSKLLSLLAKLLSKTQHIVHKHIQSEEAYMSVVLRCGQNTRMPQSLYFVLQKAWVQNKVSSMWCESIQAKLQSCVYWHYEEKE